MKITLAQSNAPVRYEIEQHGGCVLIFGEVPINSLQALMKLAPENSVIDTNLASMVEANIAFGPAIEMNNLRKKFADGSLKREAAKPENQGMSDAALQWLATGERGLSSEAMFTFLHAQDPSIFKDKDFPHPYDPGDLRRCMLMLEQVPELKPKIKMMSYASNSWAALVNVWEVLEEMMDDEAPIWREPHCGGRAPKTYEFMKNVLKPFEKWA